MTAPRLAGLGLMILAAVAALLWFDPSTFVSGESVVQSKSAPPGESPFAAGEPHAAEREVPTVSETQQPKPDSVAAEAPWFGVQVLRSGKPSVGATVRIGAWVRTTDDRGIVGFTRDELVTDPEILLRGEIVCVASAGNAGAQRKLPLGPAQIRMELTESAGNTVRGEVVDSQGRPMVGARVRFESGVPSGNQVRITDTKGEFAFEGLAAETSALEVAIDGITLDRRVVAVPSRHRIVIPERTGLSIQVYGNTAGEGVTIAAVWFGPERAGFEVWRESSSAVSPQFHSEGLPAGETLAVAVLADGFAPVYREVPTPRPEPMTFLLERRDPLRIHLPGCAGRGVVVSASNEVGLESSNPSNQTFTISEQVELDVAGTATLKRLSRDRMLRFQASVKIERGAPERLRFLGGLIDPTRGLEHSFPEIALHRVRLFDPTARQRFILRFEFGPPPGTRLPDPLAYSRGYGVLGAHRVAADENGELVLDWPLGKSVTADIVVPGQRTRSVEFEVLGTGDVPLRDAAPR